MKVSRLFVVLAVMTLSLFIPGLCKADNTGLMWSSGNSYGNKSYNEGSYREEHPLVLKLGIYLPSDSGLRNNLGNTWYDVGIEYTPRQNSSTNKGFLYLDYDSAYNTAYDAFGNSASESIDTIGLGFGVKKLFADAQEQSVTPYVGAGVGVYFNQLDVSVNNAYYGSFWGSSSSTSIGGKLFVGLQINKQYSAEIAYTDPGKLDGVQLNGYTFDIGLTF